MHASRTSEMEKRERKKQNSLKVVKRGIFLDISFTFIQSALITFQSRHVLVFYLFFYILKDD